MARKGSPSMGKKKGDGKSPSPPTTPQDVTIEVCEDGMTAYVGHSITWTNHGEKRCHIKFRKEDDGCPVDPCSFWVPAVSASGPGEFLTKVVGPGGGTPFRYRSGCCSKVGIPKVIIE
jgi:hypothetical protein